MLAQIHQADSNATLLSLDIGTGSTSLHQFSFVICPAAASSNVEAEFWLVQSYYSGLCETCRFSFSDTIALDAFTFTNDASASVPSGRSQNQNQNQSADYPPYCQPPGPKKGMDMDGVLRFANRLQHLLDLSMQMSSEKMSGAEKVEKTAEFVSLWNALFLLPGAPLGPRARDRLLSEVVGGSFWTQKKDAGCWVTVRQHSVT
jgi:hypothetical protein